ncbi:MAG: serine hydrolase, partial [Dehalococcoidia bacterium]
MQELERRLNAIADAHTGTCTWALTDLGSGAHIGRDEDATMPPASLAKVPILVTLYRAVEDGRLRLDERLRYEEQHRSLGSGVLARMSFGVEMTVRDAATLMIIISDNTATNMCLDLVGIDAVNGEMERHGLRDTRLFQRCGDAGSRGARGRNLTTAREMTKLLALIGRHECVTADADEDMLRILRRQDYRHELSGELPWNEMNTLGDDPKQAWVAEKGGADRGGVRAGGSIFKGRRGFFAMSPFCEGSTRPGSGRASEGNVILGRLGKAAWD